MISAFVLSASLALPETCRMAAEEFFKGENTSREIPLRACAMAFQQTKNPEAAWHLFSLYQHAEDEQTAEYWLIEAREYPQAAKILAQRLEARQKIREAAILWAKGDCVEHAVELCLNSNTEVPDPVKKMLEKADSGHALWLKARLALPENKALALSFLSKSVEKKFAAASDWKNWLEGKIPDIADKQTAEAVAADPDTPKNAELTKRLLERAIALNLPQILRRYAKNLEVLPKELQDKAYAQLSVYPEFARMEAVRRQQSGDGDQALALMKQAAFFGDPQAVFFEVMNQKPQNVEEMREKARKLSSILFSENNVPDSVRASCAAWLSFFFLNREAAKVDVPLACEMAQKAHFTSADAMRFADALLLLGSVDTGRTWLAKAEEGADPEVLFELSRRYRSLKDTQKWLDVMTRAAERGHVRANVALGRYELNNKKEAEGILRISAAADASDAEALYLRGMLGLTKKMPRTNEEIIDDLILALAAGEGQAGVELSKMSAKGGMLPLDPRESARYAHLAAKAGDREGMRIFGIYAIKGYGMNPNRMLAARWLAEAAAQGDKEAETICREEGFDQNSKDLPLPKEDMSRH